LRGYSSEVAERRESIAEQEGLVKDFILGNMLSGVIVFDRNMQIVFSNKRAELFLKYYNLPDEIRTICRRIFDAARRLKS
jgi:PAS domain-containing protein